GRDAPGAPEPPPGGGRGGRASTRSHPAAPAAGGDPTPAAPPAARGWEPPDADPAPPGSDRNHGPARSASRPDRRSRISALSSACGAPRGTVFPLSAALMIEFFHHPAHPRGVHDRTPPDGRPVRPSRFRPDRLSGSRRRPARAGSSGSP